MLAIGYTVSPASVYENRYPVATSGGHLIFFTDPDAAKVYRGRVRKAKLKENYNPEQESFRRYRPGSI